MTCSDLHTLGYAQLYTEIFYEGMCQFYKELHELKINKVKIVNCMSSSRKLSQNVNQIVGFYYFKTK